MPFWLNDPAAGLLGSAHVYYRILWLLAWVGSGPLAPDWPDVSLPFFFFFLSPRMVHCVYSTVPC